MSCCGKPRASAEEPPVWRGRGAPGNPPPRPNVEVSYVGFEYVGKTRLSIRGPFTGQRYDFAHPGALAEVDSRDATYFTGLSKLRKRTAPARG